MKKTIDTEEFFAWLESLLQPRRAALRARCTLSFYVVEDGPYCVDTGARQMIDRRWRRDAQVSVLTNRRTLSDLATGRFNPAHPGPEHLFVWGGDKQTLNTMARALEGGMTAFGARLAALRAH